LHASVQLALLVLLAAVLRAMALRWRPIGGAAWRPCSPIANA